MVKKSSATDNRKTAMASMKRNLLVGTGILIGTGIIAGGITFFILKRKPAPLKPVANCPAAPSVAGTNADIGYGDVTDIAGFGMLEGYTNGAEVDIGHLKCTWEADAVKKTLTVDSAHTIVANQTDGLLNAAQTVLIGLPGFEASPCKDMAITTSKYTFTMGDGKPGCLVITDGAKSVSERYVKIEREDGALIPAKTLLPAILITLA
jgi:hypothetical protein